jgi:phosphotransferase system enzyme I (PtsI)
LEADLQAHETALKDLVDLPAVTRDGVLVKLCANIGKSADAVTAAKPNADGVGLYRTEFVFLVQDHFPSEEEQYRMYRTTADRLKPREVVIRVLDIGSDKLLPYFPLPREANPLLGRRGIRLLLAHPEVLRPQLRAILRLSATHPVSILLPMVGGVEDLHAAKAAIESVKASLAAEHQPFNPQVPVGAMIETPAAAIMTSRLAQEVDFFSIGTNDLVQYLLTTDRTSSDVAAYYEPLHPAVLQVLASVASAAKAKNKPVSICGEMAGNPAYTTLLLGLGFRSFSVSPGEILEIKNAIRSTSLQQADHLARQVLELGTIQEAKALLRDAKARTE